MIKLIAENMYIPGSDHYKRRVELGKLIDIGTMQDASRIILKTTADFAKCPYKDLTVIMVTKRLLNMDCSGSRKKCHIQVLGEYTKRPSGTAQK